MSQLPESASLPPQAASAMVPPPPAPQAPYNAVGKLYVGGLSDQTHSRELEELFAKYGKVTLCQVKPGGFAFIEFEDQRGADEAVATLDGYIFNGNRISVQWSRRSGARESTCYICKEPGHWARECPDNHHKGADVKSGMCFRCGEYGHIARYCKQAKERPRSGVDDRYRRGGEYEYRERARSYDDRRYDYRARPEYDEFRDRRDRREYDDYRSPPRRYEDRGFPGYDRDRRDDYRRDYPPPPPPPDDRRGDYLDYDARRMGGAPRSPYRGYDQGPPPPPPPSAPPMYRDRSRSPRRDDYRGMPEPYGSR
ncbi:uncharacterized protein BJ171DRAFT_475372 [Polychytrium aggregatum]|uniref:uncharacterized protein n=1 Tax=Polychytrium aggregatum TaxID=110093 RepID=UPI0022FE3C2D|nr:uncharacterized protein BJ171DRAFT_475372 [Polychytrium aggregatum]KAI9204033.1 hypothetical protein BJ171DRAFT_475372 [Polychytrium aggregatum]